MTTLTLHRLADSTPPISLSAIADITAALRPTGVTLERWPVHDALDTDKATSADAANDDPDAAILAAYAEDIARLQARGGYRSVDVARLTPTRPADPAARAGLRAKFLAEHTHDDDEVRFFVSGAGMFYIRHDDQVFALECTAGDLIVLPAGTRHWFDTGLAPHFTAIRLFTTPEGWVARFTGDDVAAGFAAYAGFPEALSAEPAGAA